jgi:hypothetical protein
MRSRHPGLDLPAAEMASVGLIALFHAPPWASAAAASAHCWNAWLVVPGALHLTLAEELTASRVWVQTSRNDSQLPTRRLPAHFTAALAGCAVNSQRSLEGRGCRTQNLLQRTGDPHHGLNAIVRHQTTWNPEVRRVLSDLPRPLFDRARRAAITMNDGGPA